MYLNPGNLSVLNSLGKLQVLNNDNLLGRTLSLSNLGFLRRVYLRRTWIDQWPQDLISRPFLESADLRENRIIDIPEHVYQASPTVTRNISLARQPVVRHQPPASGAMPYRVAAAWASTANS